MKKVLDDIVQCPACLCMVYPKVVERVVRKGSILYFYQVEYDCPKCGEKRIYEKS
jgi:predicted RNA-binding Zn-ribbon protein involved in translation (DUF1610 family)